MTPEHIFEEYAYFSSYSDTWLEHSSQYADKMVAELGLHGDSQVVEIASNDGYLLQYFTEQDIPVLGIEPAKNVADVAIQKGIETRVIFFDETTAQTLVDEGVRADLLIGNNVLAHVPELNSFVRGLKRVLAPDGVLTLEFPHLLRLMEGNQFDTIYHEHFSYFSLITAERLFFEHGLSVFDVEELETHGGSLRLHLCHDENQGRPIRPNVEELIVREKEAGMEEMKTYSGFGLQVEATKRNVLNFLISAKEDGKSVAGYGAPGKGNTLLNYCGIGTDLLDYTVDRNPYKQGTYLPGTRIPVFSPEKIQETQPDYVLILPWNLKDEIMRQMSFVRAWGGQFVVPIPELSVIQ